MMIIKNRPPGEKDWDWIIEKHVKTAWESLSSEVQNDIPTDVVRENLSKQIEKLREEHGVSNQIFVAHTEEQDRVGYIWVGSFRNGFTGEEHAHIINIYVSSECQGKGIGTTLMLLAEDWARQKNLTKISLNVASHNHRAVSLYGKIGFQNEVYRMAKPVHLDQ